MPIFYQKKMAEITERELHDILSRSGIDTFAWVRLSEYPEKEREAESRLYRQWIAEGMHGGMDYLSRHSHLKYHPERIVPGAQTVLTMVFPYYQEEQDMGARAGEVREYDTGRIARYAWGRDYHRVIKKKLKNTIQDLKALSERKQYKHVEFRGFVDSGPLDERSFTARAQLGHIGRNGLLINPRYGSWVFLGEIIMTLEISGSANGAERIPDPELPTGCPPGCSLCRQSCPTGAIRPDGSFDARRCISYLTIEDDGPIPPELRPLIGGRFFGCDTCQDVCPLNRGIIPTGEPDFIRHIAGPAVQLRDMLALRTREEMERYFAGSPLMRLSVEQLLRNALVAAGNIGTPELIEAVRALSEHPDTVITEHARWAKDAIRRRSRPS